MKDKSRTEILNQRHTKETMQILEKAADKTHRTKTGYVEHSIHQQSVRDGVKNG